MLVKEEYWQYIKYYRFYEKGMLPNASNWTRESNKFIEAMTIVANTYAKFQKEEQKRGRPKPTSNPRTKRQGL